MNACQTTGRIAATGRRGRFVVPALLLLAFATCTQAQAAAPDDAELLRALRDDPTVRACDCVRHATWIDQSYARIAVDAGRYRKLTGSGRARFNAHALRIAQGVYASEWGTPDIYPELFVVDSAGKRLAVYR